MPPLALCAILFAAITHATWNLAAKRAAHYRQFVWLYSVLATLLWSPLVIWLVIATQPVFSAPQWLVLIGTAVLHLGYSLALQKGYRVADLSVVYPVARGTGPLLSFIGAILVLGERPPVWAIAGMLLVVVGILLTTGLLHASTRLNSNGLMWGLITGSFIAAYTVNDGFAVKVLLIHPLLIDYFGNVSRALVLTPGALADRQHTFKQARQYLRPALTVSILGTTGYVLVLFAMKLAPISHVAPARELATLVGTIFGALVLKETVTVARAVGALCIVAGVVGLVIPG